MLNRRTALSILGSAGIGTAVFRRALAAQAVEAGPITLRMVKEAEWVSGLELTDAQREAAVKRLDTAHKGDSRVRAITLDNSQFPALRFVPYASPESRPDPRSYEAAPIPATSSESNPLPASEEDIAYASVRQLGALLRSRRISSVELTKLYLDRLRRYDPLLKCVATFTDDLAFEQAKRADRELAEQKDRGPLQGIPWGMKDILAYPGFPTTWGAPQYRNRVIDEKSAVAQRLDEAGAVLVAKLATNAFAGGSEMWYRGLTRTPWNPRLGAAGSSSGSGSAVAAGLVGFSIATETAGSIQGPAMRCGAVGLRPTYGRVSRYGCMQLCWSLDKVGAICRNVDDGGLVLAAIHGADPRDLAAVDRPYVWPSARALSTIRVGYLSKGEEEDAKRDGLRVLRELGVQLVPLAAPLLKDFELTDELIEGTVATESAASFEHLTRRGEPKGVQGWPQFWTHGHFLSAVDYLKLQRLRAVLMQRFDEMMQSVEVYVGNELSLFDNLTGHPKIVFPRKFEDKDGYPMPQPQMLTGRIYDETTLLTVAHAYQTAVGLTRRPALDQFLSEKDEILKDEKFPDETKLYVD